MKRQERPELYVLYGRCTSRNLFISARKLRRIQQIGRFAFRSTCVKIGSWATYTYCEIENTDEALPAVSGFQEFGMFK